MTAAALSVKGHEVLRLALVTTLGMKVEAVEVEEVRAATTSWSRSRLPQSDQESAT
jgi:hypothetical protein